MEPQILRDRLLGCLGGSWPDPSALRTHRRFSSQQKGYRLESLSYEVEAGVPVPAWLLIPDAATADRPAPGIAVWHQHNGQWELGKSEPAGLSGDPQHHIGPALARKGYVVLCPDALCFEERRCPQLPGGAFERFEFLRYVVAGKSLAWKNILDMRRAIDLLCSLDEVQHDHIGCYGHSMGATHCWLLGPWEPRLKCLVANCCLPTYQAIHRHHLLHCFPNFIPGFYQYGDTPDVAGLTAPRPLLMNFGQQDAGSPIEEVRSGVARIAEAYRQHNVPQNFSYFIDSRAGHEFTKAMKERTWDWFATHLNDVEGDSSDRG
jgi:dienelactone hydrolase